MFGTEFLKYSWCNPCNSQLSAAYLKNPQKLGQYARNNICPVQSYIFAAAFYRQKIWNSLLLTKISFVFRKAQTVVKIYMNVKIQMPVSMRRPSIDQSFKIV